jgi:hypothetical protein
MSVRTLAHHEADQLACAALVVGLITDLQEATEFGPDLLRQNIEAFASTYPATAEATLAHMRARADAYTFTAPQRLEQVYEVMSAYDCSAAAAPSWFDSPLRASFETLKARWRRRSWPN